MADYKEIRKALAMGPTPGPWAIANYPHAVVVQMESHKKTAYGASRYAAIGGFDRSDPEQMAEALANARLITACDPDTIRALVDERDALLDALRQIAEWPDGGNRYGQGNIKRFAQAAIDAAMQRTTAREPLNVPGCVPLYAAPVAAQKEDDAWDAPVQAAQTVRKRWPPGPTLKDLTRETTADDIALGVTERDALAEQPAKREPLTDEELTDEELMAIIREAGKGSALRPMGESPTSLRIARAVIAALRERLAKEKDNEQ